MIYRVPVRTLPDVRKVGHIRYPNGWSQEYLHQWNVLIFVCSGEFIYTFSPQRQVRLTAGMHLLIPAGVPYTATVGEDCDYYFAHFKASQSLSEASENDVIAVLKQESETQILARNQDYNTEPADCIYIAETAFHGDRVKALQYRISRCAEFRLGNSPLDRMRLLNSFLTVLLSISATTGETLLETKHLSPTVVKLTRYIEENYTSPISLQSISEQFSLSKQYIMRLFREQFGMTVTHYINEVRLRKSLDLLTFHSLSVSQVAYAVGFSSLYYFDRLFKKTYAITPTEFQKSHRLIEPSEPKEKGTEIGL